MEALGTMLGLAMTLNVTQTAQETQWSRAVALAPQYVRQLASNDPRQRSEAIAGIADIAVQRSDGAIPPALLTDALPMLMSIARQDPEPDLRSSAIDAIGVLGQDRSLGSRADAAVRTLSAALTDAAPKVREMAALMLGVMGRPARRAIPALRHALRDPSSQMRLNAAESLGSLGAQEAREDLRRALTDSDPYVRLQAKAALEALSAQRGGTSDE